MVVSKIYIHTTTLQMKNNQMNQRKHQNPIYEIGYKAFLSTAYGP